MPTIEERIEAANAKLAELTAAQDSLKMQEVQIQEEMASLMIQEYRALVGSNI